MYMPNSGNIVLACEQMDATSIINSVQGVLTEKLFTALDNKKQEMGKKFFAEGGSTYEFGEKKDSYDKADDKLKEAIDYVIESVLEANADLHYSIGEAAEKHEVEEEKLKEYFSDLLGEAYGVPAGCNDSDYRKDRNRGAMGDMDTDKRTRYESTVIEQLKSGNIILKLHNGSHIEVTEEQGQVLATVYENLNEENQGKMYQQLTNSKKDFYGMVDFAKRLTE